MAFYRHRAKHFRDCLHSVSNPAVHTALAVLLLSYRVVAGTPQLGEREQYAVALARLSVALAEDGAVQRVRINYEGSDDYVIIGPGDDEHVTFSGQMLLHGEPRQHAIDPGSDLAVSIEGTAQHVEHAWKLTDFRVEHAALVPN